MFTGIITDIGTVRAIAKSGDTRFEITTAYDLPTVDMGASIACNGCCLTVIEKGSDWFAIQASAETLSKTTLGNWTEGTRVNLERALKIGDELGGHIVSGHVDGLGEIVSITPEGDFEAFPLPGAERACTFHRAEGLGGHRRNLADGERGRGQCLRREHYSAHASRHHLGRHGAGPERQH